jgi:hypothetical protein
MRRMLVVVCVVLAAIPSFLAGAAGAKGAVEGTINGPRVGGGGKGGGGIKLEPEEATWLAEESGLYDIEALAATAPDSPPDEKYLGPRYVLTLQIDWGKGETQEIVQHLYPYATTGPWVFTPEQKWLDNQTNMGPLWYTRSEFLRDLLIDYGLPEQSPITVPQPPPGGAGNAPVSNAPAEAPAEPPAQTPWVAVVGIGLVVIAAGAVLLRSGLGRTAS